MGQGWQKALLTTKTFTVLAAIRHFFLGAEGKVEEKEKFSSFSVSSFEEGLMTSYESVRQTVKVNWGRSYYVLRLSPTDHVGEYMALSAQVAHTSRA